MSDEVQVALPDAESTRAYGRAVAALLRPGDLVVLTGPLGAGKTTLVQGIGTGLGVRGQVASPTFIIARVHPSLAHGPALVHVDAYRLGSLDELEALDLDESLGDSVTVVEWGEGLVEVLSEDRLEVVLDRGQAATPAQVGDPGTGDGSFDDVGARTATVRGIGPRWAGVELPRA
jgi:tRNA threonylcarbamoyladenosine biosynthesis protein TsaE